MGLTSFSIKLGLATVSLLLICQCGIREYAGQPGIATNIFSKIHVEYLDKTGLWFYEVTYDNRTLGTGVAAIVTKLYPGAERFTSSIRKNVDGSVYRTKAPAKGALVQAISIPSQNKIILAQDSQVQLFLSYNRTLNEVDLDNQAESNLFKKEGAPFRFTTSGLAQAQMQLNLLKAGRFQRDGSIAYGVKALEMGGKKLVSEKPVSVSTDLFQFGIQSGLTSTDIAKMVSFIEGEFPKGYLGGVKLHLEGSDTPVEVQLGIHTLKTAERNGTKIVKGATPEELDALLNKIRRVL